MLFKVYVIQLCLQELEVQELLLVSFTKCKIAFCVSAFILKLLLVTSLHLGTTGYYR